MIFCIEDSWTNLERSAVNGIRPRADVGAREPWYLDRDFGSRLWIVRFEAQRLMRFRQGRTGGIGRTGWD